MPKKSKETGLTAVQLKQIADRLPGTTMNVYLLSKTLFGVEFQQEDWDGLKVDHDLFRCRECNVWQSVKEEWLPNDVCNDCYE